MDGENNGSENPMNKWDDLGGCFTTPIFGSTPIHVFLISALFYR